MGLEQDLAEAQLRVVQLEAHEANWVAREAQWVNVLTDRLHAIVGLQEQREQLREEIEQLMDERFVHLQAQVDMDGQLEAMDQDLEAANEMIQMLQQPVPPPAPGAMDGDPDDAQSMVDDSEAPPLDPMDTGSPTASVVSSGGGAH
jgi:chromosome segregation ATPase